MFFEKPGDMMLSASPAFIRLQKNLESKLKYKGAKKVARTNPEITNKKPEYSGAEIMTITMDKKPVSNIYLRNFCGAVYKDSKWVDINNDWKNFDCSEKQKKIIENELYNSSLECNLAEKTGIKINYIANIGDYLAIPYGVNHKNSSDYKFESDFLAKYTGRKYKYSFEGINANIYGDEELISIYNNSRGNEELCWNDYLNYVNDKYNMSNTYISSVKNMAYGLQSVSNITYYYNCFYEKMPAFDYSSSDQPYGSECKINNYLVAKAVAGILQNEYTYSLELDEIEENTEPISYFLDNSRKGYCIHFATAGALILREMNIPCRYVSGYIAKADSFVYKNGKYQSTVSDKTAHAWVEVYIDKLGWIPVEMTPGYNDTSNWLPTNNEPTNTPTFSPEATSIPEATPTFTPVPEPTTEPGNTATPIITVTGGGDNHSQGNDSDASAPGDDTNKSGILRGFIYIISGAAGVALFAAIIIKLRKKYINYIIIEINSKRYRNAIKRINKRIYRRLLKKQGIKLRQMNDEKYLYMLVENFKSISEQQWGEYYSIVKKAIYSREKLDSKEAVFCYDIYKNMN
ncbi:MAG: transglutaminase domain-containing protein [Clostridiales bacterium]|nr:transglutaminase domain-containing protein [Clostridiales bacterium]